MKLPDKISQWIMEASDEDLKDLLEIVMNNLTVENIAAVVNDNWSIDFQQLLIDCLDAAPTNHKEEYQQSTYEALVAATERAQKVIEEMKKERVNGK